MSASAAHAQSVANLLGFTAGFETSYVDRGGANTTHDDVLQCVWGRHYRHAFVDPSDPTGMARRIVGFRIAAQDQVGYTPELFTLVGHLDDATRPGTPDASSSGSGVWFRTGRINTPPSAATGPAIHVITVGFNPPATPARMTTSHAATDNDV